MPFKPGKDDFQQVKPLTSGGGITQNALMRDPSFGESPHVDGAVGGVMCTFGVDITV